MNKDQRTLLAEKLADSANVILGALALTQVLSEEPFHPGIFLLGILLYCGLVFAGVYLLRRTRHVRK
jgi:hypothetical protein